MDNAITIGLINDTTTYDLYNRFGVRLLRGGYEALLTPSPMKDYVTNQSRLEHGTRYIANGSNSKIQARNIGINVILEGSNYDDYLSKYENFLNFFASGMIYLRVTRLKRRFKLVYTGCSSFTFYSYKKATFTVEFIEPNPKDRATLS